MIACELYDYLEVACVYKMELKLEMYSGEILFGKAINLQINDARQECLVIEDNQKKHSLIEIDGLKRMTSLFPSSHFSTVEFSSNV